MDVPFGFTAIDGTDDAGAMTGTRWRLLVELRIPIGDNVRPLRHVAKRPVFPLWKHDLAQPLHVVAPAVGLAVLGGLRRQMLNVGFGIGRYRADPIKIGV